VKGIHRIVLAAGNPELGAGLTPYARMVAWLFPAAVIQLVHVLDPEGGGVPVSHREALQTLERIAGRDLPADRPVECKVLDGDRLDCLLQFIAEQAADLIVVGHPLSHSPRRSLARRLAMKAPCSVWMAPSGAVAAVRRVVAATDFSQAANEALAAAIQIAGQAGASCLALHISAAGAGLREALCDGVNVPLIVDPGPTVAAAARRLTSPLQGDLLVIGARGGNPASTVLLGREPDLLLRESPTPVLVVVPPGGRLAILESLLDRAIPAGSTTIGR
jgi:nucleotide-binding universal stress UspA family protein